MTQSAGGSSRSANVHPHLVEPVRLCRPGAFHRTGSALMHRPASGEAAHSACGPEFATRRRPVIVKWCPAAPTLRQPDPHDPSPSST